MLQTTQLTQGFTAYHHHHPRFHHHKRLLSQQCHYHNSPSNISLPPQALSSLSANDCKCTSFLYTDDMYIYIYIGTPKTIEKVNLHSFNGDIPTSITQFLTMALSEYVNARLGRLRSRAGHRCFAGRRHRHRWVSGISPRNGDFMGFCLQN